MTWRRRIARWCQRFAAWIDPTEVVTLTMPRDGLLTQARLVTEHFDQVPNMNGEWKRHQVYAALLKAYPERSKRDVALAIEAAVSQMERG